MFTLHQTIHDQYGICLWTVLTLVVLAIMVVWAIVHFVKQKKRSDEYEGELDKIRNNSTYPDAGSTDEGR